MNVSLTPELEGFVQEQVESGLYQSASEVVRESLRLLQERKQDRQARLEVLRKEIAVGLEQLDRGEGVSLDEVVVELRERNRKFSEGSSA